MRILIAAIISTLMLSTALAQESPRDIWAPEMDALGFLLGSYTVTGEIMGQDGEWHVAEPTTAHIEQVADGAALREVGTYQVPGFGYGLEADYSFDGFRDVYRVMLIDTVYGLMDIYEGAMTDGTLALTNVRAATTFPLGDGREMNLRIRIEPNDAGHLFHIDASMDAGDTWGPIYRYTYVRNEG